jgi:imidazolonepropionase-like amidohydrolase
VPAAARSALVAATAAALVALVAAACSGDDPELRGDVLITADRLFDGRELREPGAVLVTGGRIAAVGESLEAEAERTIDLGDATIMPGVIDLHVHTYQAGTYPGKLRSGVTTVRDVGAPLQVVRPAGRYAGLRVLMAGPLVTVPGGYPTPIWGSDIALDVRTPADARSAVRDLADRGAAVIKIALEPGDGGWPMLSVAEVRAIVDEAHRHDLRVTAHAARPSGVERAIAGGVDELAHTPCGATDDQVRRLAEREVEIVATLDVLQRSTGCALLAARAVELGGTLLYGSDTGVPGIPEQLEVAELRLLEEAGLSPEDVLAAATSRAGEAIGLAPLGTLAEGAPADVVAVRGDARTFRDDMARPLVVVSGGRIVVVPATG